MGDSASLGVRLFGRFCRRVGKSSRKGAKAQNKKTRTETRGHPAIAWENSVIAGPMVVASGTFGELARTRYAIGIAQTRLKANSLRLGAFA
jgi:hypothetical protein